MNDLMLGAFYQHLLAPVEAHLEGATEVLIIPHKELFEVPWAALFHIQTGQYLIQRVAPSLRVARTAADALRGINGYSLGPPPRRVNGRMFVSQPTYVEKPKYMSVGRLFHSQRKYQSDETHVASTQVGHALVVGNLLRGVPLPKAEVEAEFVAELLSGVGFEVHALMGQAATKEDVQSKIEGAKWEEEEEEEEEKTSSSGKKHTAKRKKGRIKKTLKLGAGKRRAAEEEEEEEESSEADLTMDEVQGSVRMGSGSTVVLSACNSGRGEIRAEGVVGLARGFLFAGAAAHRRVPLESTRREHSCADDTNVQAPEGYNYTHEHTKTHKRTCARTHIYTNASVHSNRHTHAPLHTHTHTITQTHTYMHTHTHTLGYTRTHTLGYTRTHSWVHTYTHNLGSTHTNYQKPASKENLGPYIERP